MPSVENPFEDVLTEKEWSKARDKTGLTSGLTEKVSMGKELTTFHKKKDVEAARHLLGKLGIYEQVLKSKHMKEKYYSKLLKLLESQQQAVQMGITIIENSAQIEEVRARLTGLNDVIVKAPNRIGDMTQTKTAEVDFTERYRQLGRRVRALKDTIPEDVFVLPGDIVAKVVQIEKDFQQLEADLEREAADSEYEDGPDGRNGRNDQQMHWDRVMVPMLTGRMNKVLSKHPNLDINGTPQTLFLGLLQPVHQEHTRDFDPRVVKELTDSLTPDPRDPLTTRWVELAERLLNDGIATTLHRGDDSAWFKFVRETTPKSDGPKKQQSFNPQPSVNPQTGMDVPGVPSPEMDDRKAYGAILMKLAGMKNDPLAAATYLSSKALAAYFPYEQTDGKKEVDPGNQTPSVLTKIRGVGVLLKDGIGRIRTSLNSQPANLEAARAEVGRLNQQVTQLCNSLPRHGDVVEKGVKQFIIKSVEDEIAAKAGA